MNVHQVLKKAYKITNNNEFVVGYALAKTPSRAKAIAMRHHPDKQAETYIALKAYRVPILDRSVLFDDGWIDLMNKDSVEKLRELKLVTGEGDMEQFWSKPTSEEFVKEFLDVEELL